MSPHPAPPPPPLGGAPQFQPAPAPVLPAPSRTSPRGLIAAAVLLAALATVLGYYSLELWQGQQAARTELMSTRQAVAKLEGEQSESRQQAQQRKVQVTRLEQALGEARTQLVEAQENLDELSAERADIDEQMRDYREIAARFQSLIDSGRLQVHLRRGRMVVDLPAQVLFPSGSAEVSKEGVQALREVTRILRRVKGKRFIVAGHTDNVKIQAKTVYSSNWALSAARAVAVTETLVRFGMRPRQLVAAGYGPNDPVATNRNERGRQQNRRIEIILEPRVRELPARLEEKL